MLDTIKKTSVNLFRGFLAGFSTLKEMFTHILKSRYWWLMPMLLALVLCGVFLVVVNTVTTTMPFVYALF